jgi:hypothetical protein
LLCQGVDCAFQRRDQRPALFLFDPLQQIVFLVGNASINRRHRPPHGPASLLSLIVHYVAEPLVRVLGRTHRLFNDIVLGWRHRMT